MYKLLLTLSRWMAYLGGAMLLLLILLTCISVFGRLLNSGLHSDFMEGFAPGLAKWLLGLGIGPIYGDVELTEAGIAFAIFAFLPWCHLTGGHAAVDIFTNKLTPRAARFLHMAIAVVFGAVMVLIAVQLFAGMQSKMRSGQTTFLIEFPLWWAYALSMFGAVLAAVVAVYLASVRLVEAVHGRAIIPRDAGAEH